MANKAPSFKQKKVMKEILENPSTSMRQAMLKAGYSPNTACDPTNLTNTKSWEELMEEYFPDGLLSETINQGLKATKPISARIILQKGDNEVGNQDAWSKTDDFIEVEDYPTRHKYVETALKLKKKFPKDEIDHTHKGDINVNIRDYGDQYNASTEAEGSNKNE